MTSFIRVTDSKTSVKYTPCSKDDQTTDEELDEIAVVLPGDPQAEKTESEDELANGPRLLPTSRDGASYPSDRIRLIRSDHCESTGTDRSDPTTPDHYQSTSSVHRASPAYSIKTPEKNIRHRADSRQSLMDVMSHKIEKLSKHRPTVYGPEIAILNKARSTDLMTPREIRKLRRKEIDARFGKKALKQQQHTAAETADDKKKPFRHWTFVFDPSGRFSYWWSFVVSVAFIYNFWVIIYRFAFAEINADTMVIWFTLDYLADLLYIMDIAFHFRTGYLEEGVLQTDGVRLRIHYMNTTKFYVDLLCLLPLDFLYLSVGFKSIFRCFRLVKIYRYWAFLDRTERHTNYPNMIRTATLLHYLFCIFHWNACLHYIVAFKLQNSPIWDYQNDTVYYVNYIKGLYYSTCALTTVGDLPSPQTPGEFAFLVVQVCVGFLLFAAVLGHIANIVASISAARKDFQAKLDGVKTYMMLRRVPLHLQERVIRWFDYLWMSHKTTDEEKSLSLLPDKLKAEIAIHVHLDTLKRVEIFQNTDPGFLHELVLRLRPVLFSPGDYICRKGEVGKEMYIVNRGRLQVVADNGKHVLATLKPGSYFGEISILNMGTEGNRRTASVRSVGYSDLFCLSKKDMWDVLKEYPTARVKLEAIAVKRLAKYKKAPLEKAALARSKSTPGLVESTGKIPLEQMQMSSDYLATAARARNSYSDQSQHSPSPSDEKDYRTEDNQAYALTPPASPSVFTPQSAAAVPSIGVSPPRHEDLSPSGQAARLEPALGPAHGHSHQYAASVPTMQLLTPSYTAPGGVMTPSYRSSSSNLISPGPSPRTPRRLLAGEGGGSLVAGSTGSLARDPSSDILLQEISRLRLRINSMETENASLSIKFNQQQWEVQQRLSEIEMHMCGGSEDAPSSDDGKTNKESAI